MKKVIFKKGYNPKKPKRWYVFYIPSLADDRAETFYEYLHMDGRELVIKLRAAGFHPSKCRVPSPYISTRTRKMDDRPYVGGNYHIFLHFNSHAEEARFIIWASNGIEVKN
jgi:hypothetical protein